MCPTIKDVSTVTAFDDLIAELEVLRQDIEQQVSLTRRLIPELDPVRLKSAENLLHYLSLRGRDIRPLQDRLARVGMSSLGRVEPHVMATIDAVLHNLRLVSGNRQAASGFQKVIAAFDSGADQLENNTKRLLGEHPDKRRVHIIVTMPAEAADDYLMVHQLLESGMNCMRINCAHDGPEQWKGMISSLRSAERATGKACQVLMDLCGPKLRLGPMETRPVVKKIKPFRDKDGHVKRPARVWLTRTETPFTEVPNADASIVVDARWLGTVAPGDRITFKDARGSNRKWRVSKVSSEGCWVEAKKTAYVRNGLVLNLIMADEVKGMKTRITSLADEETVCEVRTGDILFVSNSNSPGTPARRDERGELLNPGNVSLSIAQVYRDVNLGDPMFFDDGRIAGIVEKKSENQIQIRITHTRKPRETLEGYRGVNLPDTHLQLPALGDKDLKDIAFASRHADMVGLSFANSADDVAALYQQLQHLGRPDMGAILKIETKRGFSNLPAILLEALKFTACGVMIARGDLAVECGFERMSEIQEEILWVCEAAHVPVIWATQVLEGLTRRGQVSRAEITDAAMSQAAEAVMLNKGSHIIEAVEMLDNILQRMQGHHRKKGSMLRKLELASGFHTRMATTP